MQKSYLDQPSSEVLVNKKVEPKQLKGISPVAVHKLLLVAEDRINNQIPHTRHKVLPHAQLILGELLIEKVLKDLEAEGVTVLELPIVIAVLLKAVVRQMDVVLRGVHIIVKGGSPEVAVLVHEDVDVRGYEDPDPDVEFAPVVEKRAFDVFLCDPRRIQWLRLQELLDFFNLLKDLDPSP